MICLGRKCCFQEISYAGNPEVASSYILSNLWYQLITSQDVNALMRSNLIRLTRLKINYCISSLVGYCYQSANPYSLCLKVINFASPTLFVWSKSSDRKKNILWRSWQWLNDNNNQMKTLIIDPIMWCLEY
jgi:hypothetical protein